MSKYCIIKTACNKRETADEIIDFLLKERLISGVQTKKILKLFKLFKNQILLFFALIVIYKKHR